jgi:hypothetical protein
MRSTAFRKEIFKAIDAGKTTETVKFDLRWYSYCYLLNRTAMRTI